MRRDFLTEIAPALRGAKARREAALLWRILLAGFRRGLAMRGADEDLSAPVVGAVTAALATESKRSRSSRRALFETGPVQDRFIAGICRTRVPAQADAHAGAHGLDDIFMS